MTAGHHPAPSLGQKLFAEFAGTTMLLCAVIGSGIMAEKLLLRPCELGANGNGNSYFTGPKQ